MCVDGMPSQTILQVLEHHNIQVITIDGNKRQRDRITTLEAFKSSRRDGPRVLLISNVGSLGLNIAFANILIIVVSGGGFMEASGMLMV